MNNFKRGYGFRPSDEELIEHLRNTTLSGTGTLGIYLYPECKRRKINEGNNNGKRKPLINRATKNGKWKPSGDPRKNKYVLGKLMIQSEPITNKSSSKGQQLPPQVHIDFHDQLEMEVSDDIYDWVQNQSTISHEQPNEFASSSPVDNYCTTYPEEVISNRDNFVNDYQVSQVQLPSNLENYVADDAVLQNLQVRYMITISTPEVPNINVGAENQLNADQYDNSYQNLVSFHNNETYPVPSSDSNNHPIAAEISHMKVFAKHNLHRMGRSLEDFEFRQLIELFGDIVTCSKIQYLQTGKLAKSTRKPWDTGNTLKTKKP
ncbi:hypothetical protein COLO4_28398 [Corchorus olitorius]|uniref:No apical meristem (NAM) protein n=1 Tax=Corchorus olitorius TaxID=93759 RepID=A0A1R3HL95_9ROSI|nr:hypothetical protein COLO4_28398 [Corchorus olitorius]